MRARRLLLALFLVASLPFAAGRSAWAQQGNDVGEIAREFGGIYRDPDLERYVASIGQLLAKVSDAPEKIRSFTILDSDIVNAFSLPSGEVFVSRGLVALANNEAELASVLGHEIGHITAGHGAQRQTRGVLTQLGAGLIGALLGNPSIGNIAGVGAQLYLQHYSREQEFEADTLGIRYMGRAGYDQRQAAAFLRSLEAQSQLEGKLTGTPAGDQAYNIMADHPRTLDRVERAIEAAGASPPPQDAMVEHDLYLKKIDGLLYGDDPDQGFMHGRTYMHRQLRFAFDVPQGFDVNNGADQVVAQGSGGGVIVFDRAEKPFRGTPAEYLRAWQPKSTLSAPESLTVNGMPAATATAEAQLNSGGAVHVRFVAIELDPGIFYRFMFISPPKATAQLEPVFRQTAMSFRRLTAQEAATIQPLRIRAVAVGNGDTIETLARRMAFDRLQRERFTVLNGLFDGAALRPGEHVKIVVEGGRG